MFYKNCVELFGPQFSLIHENLLNFLLEPCPKFISFCYKVLCTVDL